MNRRQPLFDMSYGGGTPIGDGDGPTYGGGGGRENRISADQVTKPNPSLFSFCASSLASTYNKLHPHNQPVSDNISYAQHTTTRPLFLF